MCTLVIVAMIVIPFLGYLGLLFLIERACARWAGDVSRDQWKMQEQWAESIDEREDVA